MLFQAEDRADVAEKSVVDLEKTIDELEGTLLDNYVSSYRLS